MRKLASNALGKLVIAGALVALASTGTGCKKLFAKKGLDGGTTTTGTSTTTSNPADDADEALQEKLDEYIKCLNSLSSSIHGSQKRYLSLVPKDGPNGKQSWADIYKMPDGAAAKCSTGVVKAKAMTPKNPSLEQAGDDFAKYATELEPQITTLNKYFENKDYRDDKWAKAKLMHPALMSSFASFNKADNQLHTVLDGITKPLATRTLQRIEREEGKRYRYHRKHVLNTARDLVEAADPGGEDDAVDFNLYNASYTELETSVNDLKTYGDAHKSELNDQKKAANWPVADNHYDTFVRSAQDYLKTSKDFLRCLRDSSPKAKTASGKIAVDKIPSCADGRPLQQQDDVVKKYNEFIRTSNSNQFP